MSIRKFLYAMMLISFVVAHAADRPQFDPKEEGYVETGLPLHQLDWFKTVSSPTAA